MKTGAAGEIPGAESQAGTARPASSRETDDGADRVAASELVLAADPGVIERAADPAEFIVAACQRAKAWLAKALEHGDIEHIAEARSQAEAVRVYTMQKQLGTDAQLAATEIVRRAERGIGLAIRRGQAAGVITRRAGHGANQHWRAEPADNGFSAARPSDYASPDELTGNGAGIYHLADGVTDEDFEGSLADAKAEKNLSRANVVRKLRDRRGRSERGAGGLVPEPADRSPAAARARRQLIAEFAAQKMTSRQIADRLGISGQRVRAIAREQQITIPADEVIGRTRRLNPNRIVRETTHALEGLAIGVGLADPAGLDPAQASEWAASMTCSLRVLSKFARQMKEVTA